MIKIILITVLGAYLVDAQQHQFQPQPQQQQQPYSGYNQGYSGYSPNSGYSSAFTTTTTPRPYFPPAQVHYVNIGQDLAGDYKFGYDTGKGPLGQSFREETRLPDGTVMGAYGYLDEHGKQRIVKYTAGKEGFKVDSDTPAPSNGQSQEQPQQASRPASPPTQQVSHSLPQAPPQYVPQQQLPQPAPRPAPQPQYQPQYQQPPTPPRYQQLSLPQYAPSYRPQPQGLQYQPAPQQTYQPPQQSYQPPPSYQAQAQYQPPAVNFQKPAPAPQYSEPRRPHYRSNEELLSGFPQLPGVQLMVINPKPRPANLPPQAYNPGYLPSLSSSSGSGLLQSSSRNVPRKEEEEQYTGPVVINAALLNYDIGSAGRRQ